MTVVRDLLASTADAHDFTGAPCIGRWALFDPAATYEPADDVAERHGRAQRLCALCPHEHVAACAALLRTIPKPHRSGVWAGQVLGPVRTEKRGAA